MTSSAPASKACRSRPFGVDAARAEHVDVLVEQPHDFLPAGRGSRHPDVDVAPCPDLAADLLWRSERDDDRALVRLQLLAERARRGPEIGRGELLALTDI